MNSPGDIIRQRRIRLGISQEALAHDVDTSQTTISEIERGRRDLGDVAFNRVVKLARSLRWTLLELQEAIGADLHLERPTSNDNRSARIPVLDARTGRPLEPPESIDLPPDWTGEHAAYRLPHDPHEPDVPPGSTIIVRLETRAALGQLVAAQVPDRGVIARRLIATTPEHHAILKGRQADLARLIHPDASLVGVVREQRRRHD